MKSMVEERLNQTERIDRSIVSGNRKYISRQLKENFDAYVKNVDVAIDDYHVFRITALSATLLEHLKYDNNDNQKKVRDNSEALRLQLRIFVQGIIDLAKIYPNYFDNKYPERMIDEIQMGTKTSSDYFDGNDDIIAKNTLDLEGTINSQIERLLVKYDELLFRDLGVDEKTKSIMKRDLENLKQTILFDIEKSNKRLFDNYVRMTETFKNYVVSYESAVKSLQEEKKEEPITHEEKPVVKSVASPLRKYSNIEDYLFENTDEVEADYDGPDFDIPNLGHRI